MYLCGSASALGAWDPSKALPLIWAPGNGWTASAVLSTDGQSLNFLSRVSSLVE